MSIHICPSCKSKIPENSPGKLCPSCALRGAEELPKNGITAPSLKEIAEAFPELEVISLIGQGGMGSVYQVRQPALDRVVALKILSPTLSDDPAFAERFAREARVMGKLQHPHIVTIFESGECGGYFYLLMEYVDGVNLREAMQAGRFTPEQALAVVPEICDALQAAHSEDVLHRDIKPENILLDREGQVKIVDFGIARLAGDSERNFTLTMTGHTLGSAAYMAPEQHEQPHQVDHRADIYSLGVVIYEMLTGELPLGRFPLPGERAAVNSRIDEIVLKTLEKERDLRQQSVTEVKTDFASVSSHKKEEVKEQTTPKQKASSFFTNPQNFSFTALGLWIGGIVTAILGSLISDVFISLGCIIAFLGAIVCSWILWNFRKGKHPNEHRILLIIFFVIPAFCFIALLSYRSVEAHQTREVTRDLIKSHIKAAKHNDELDFKRSYSTRIIKLINNFNIEPDILMPYWHSTSFKCIKTHNDQVMRVILKDRSTGKEVEANLIKLNGSWKIDTLLPTTENQTLNEAMLQAFDTAKSTNQLSIFNILSDRTLEEMEELREVASDEKRFIDVITSILEALSHSNISAWKINPDSPNKGWIDLKSPFGPLKIEMVKERGFWQINGAFGQINGAQSDLYKLLYAILKYRNTDPPNLTKMRSLQISLLSYYAANDQRYPDNLQQLLTTKLIDDKNLLEFEGCKLHYIVEFVNNKGKKVRLNAGDGEKVILYTTPNKNNIVIYSLVDGSVHEATSNEFDKILAEQKK